MRQKRFLLVTAALSTAVSVQACGKDPVAKPDEGEKLPLPANPKGSFYDAGVAEPPPPPPPPPDPVPPPANPKGSFYDAGIQPPPPPPPPPPPTANKDAGRVIPHPPANPKGPHYDAGLKKPMP